MSKQEDTLKAARKRIEVTLQETRRRAAKVEEERAANLLAALWLLLDEFGATDDMLRSVMSVPTMALDVIEAVSRRDHYIATITDGAWAPFDASPS